MTEHAPHRPSWTCRACPDDTSWPCGPGRTLLAEQYAGRRADLLQYLASGLVDAIEDGITGSPAEVYGRIVGWARRLPARTSR